MKREIGKMRAENCYHEETKEFRKVLRMGVVWGVQNPWQGLVPENTCGIGHCCKKEANNIALFVFWRSTTSRSSTNWRVQHRVLGRRQFGRSSERTLSEKHGKDKYGKLHCGQRSEGQQEQSFAK